MGGRIQLKFCMCYNLGQGRTVSFFYRFAIYFPWKIIPPPGARALAEVCFLLCFSHILVVNITVMLVWMMNHVFCVGVMLLCFVATCSHFVFLFCFLLFLASYSRLSAFLLWVLVWCYWYWLMFGAMTMLHMMWLLSSLVPSIDQLTYVLYYMKKCLVTLAFLGRLPKVDLIILEGEKCPSVRPQKVSSIWMKFGI